MIFIFHQPHLYFDFSFITSHGEYCTSLDVNVFKYTSFTYPQFLTSLHVGRDFHRISQQMDHWLKFLCSRMFFYIKIVDNKTIRYVTLTFEISIFIDNKGNKYSIDYGLYQLLIFRKQQTTANKFKILYFRCWLMNDSNNEKQNAFFVFLQTQELCFLRDTFLSLKKTSIIFFFV